MSSDSIGVRSTDRLTTAYMPMRTHIALRQAGRPMRPTMVA